MFGHPAQRLDIAGTSNPQAGTPVTVRLFLSALDLRDNQICMNSGRSGVMHSPVYSCSARNRFGIF